MLKHAYRQEMSKQAYQEKLEAELAEWDGKLNLIKAKVRNLKADARIQYETQLAVLLQKREEAVVKLENLHKRSEDAWEDLKEGTERAWSELAKAMESVVARFK